MGLTRLERTYRCLDDCRMEGCPGHTAALEFQSVSDAFSFYDGRGVRWSAQTPEMGALVAMLYELARSRFEVAAMLRAASAEDALDEEG